MATTPHVPVPAAAEAGGGAPSLSAVVKAHAPELARARGRFFGSLGAVVREDPATHEVARLATAEHTGCRLCRNIRNRAAVEAGVDEEFVARVRAGDAGDLDPRAAAALHLATAVRSVPTAAPAAIEVACNELGARDAAAVLTSTLRALSDGKALVALGLEPASMPVTVI